MPCKFNFLDWSREESVITRTVGKEFWRSAKISCIDRCERNKGNEWEFSVYQRIEKHSMSAI